MNFGATGNSDMLSKRVMMDAIDTSSKILKITHNLRVG